MAERTGHLHGEATPRMTKAVASASVINIGELVFEDSGASDVPKAAADITWNTNIGTTQEDFHDQFKGVAAQRSRSGDTDPIRVNTTGVHIFNCASATFAAGDLVGPAKDTGNALLSDTVVAVATANLAIGRVTKHYTSNTTRVEVEIVGTLDHGGPQAAA